VQSAAHLDNALRDGNVSSVRKTVSVPEKLEYPSSRPDNARATAQRPDHKASNPCEVLNALG
jgi:hypothetical protein